MQIPETPTSINQLDLIKRLSDYGAGDASWLEHQPQLGQNTKQSCQILYTNIVSFVNEMLTPLLGKINAREMETFTMHDSNHALKVAHLMWHIIHPDRRNSLTPPEIALLVISAFLHDLGMALSPQQREERLSPESDLWHHLEVDEDLKKSINQLKEQASNNQIPEPIRDRARRKLYQAEEALLCQDTRERHATSQRYEDLLTNLQHFHNEEPSKLPDVESCLSFDGDSFRNKLIEICVSHGQDLDFLLENDETNIERPRFPRDYTLGSCTADLHMVAAVLRLADILDFDRERTPSVLFYYLLPTNLASHDDKSVLEWSKHLTISNWHIEKDAIIFRGHCKNHIIHHAVVQFCSNIENEIKSTLDTFSVRKTPSPFNLPTSVQTNVEQHGYTYVPYKFELDDNRVYQLLMGGAIYENPLVAARELVQNAVDACKLKDALTRMYEPQTTPNTTNRITIRYEEPTDQCQEPKLTVTDTGTGMDGWILENYFLKVGMSYYNSSDFNNIRFQLQTKNEELDFAPISEFGIGFLSCFLLADRLKVTTAMWESIRGDTLKRTLIIDGPTRLIRMSEQRNEGLDRFKGTSVTLYLSRGSRQNKNQPPQWNQIKDYLIDICQDLPYRLNLEHLSSDGHVTRDSIDRILLIVQLPEQLEPLAVRIPVNDQESGLEGEIAIVNPYEARKLERALSEDSPVCSQSEVSQSESSLLRGGFKIGWVPGLPNSWVARSISSARLRFNWMSQPDRKYPLPNLSRDKPTDSQLCTEHVCRLWLDYFLQNIDNLPKGLLYELQFREFFILSFPELWRYPKLKINCSWLERYDAFTIYRLGKQGWSITLGDEGQKKIQDWENGTCDSLYIGDDISDVYFSLLTLVLPKITNFQVGCEPLSKYYLKPPQSGWQSSLEGWHNYITSPVELGPFIEYIDSIVDFLYHNPTRSTLLNIRYKDRLLKSFRKSELELLACLFHKLSESRHINRQAELTNTESELFQRAHKYLGDLKISSVTKSWRIDSFAIPKVADSH